MNTLIQLDPEFRGAYNGRKVAYFYTQKYQETISDISIAIQKDKNFILSYFDKGNSYLALK